MDFYKTRSELRGMGIKEVLKMATSQKIRICVMINNPCRFHFRYNNFNFCVSEILGENCQVERVQKLEETLPTDDRKVYLPSFLQQMEVEPGLPEEKAFGFNVYWRDRLTRSITLLGSVTERRKKERTNNLNDLLKRAVSDFSDQVKDPLGIFLLGS